MAFICRLFIKLLSFFIWRCLICSLSSNCGVVYPQGGAAGLSELQTKVCHIDLMTSSTSFWTGDFKNMTDCLVWVLLTLWPPLQRLPQVQLYILEHFISFLHEPLVYPGSVADFSWCCFLITANPNIYQLRGSDVTPTSGIKPRQRWKPLNLN